MLTYKAILVKQNEHIKKDMSFWYFEFHAYALEITLHAIEAQSWK